MERYSREWWKAQLPNIQAFVNGKSLELRTSDDKNPWIPFTEDQISFCCSPEDYRIKPKTILVYGVEVPAPETKKPELGHWYYCPFFSHVRQFSKTRWSDNNVDNYRLSNGLVYLRKEDAIARTTAMLLQGAKNEKEHPYNRFF